MAIYILELPNESKETIFSGGVDFYEGRGSTNSKPDADRLASRFGCRIVEVKEDPEVMSTPTEAKPEAAARKDDTAPPVFVNRADRKAHEKLVRRLSHR